MKYILSIDSGTTSARAIIFDGTTETASCKIPIKQIYPLPGWVEHDPDELFSAVEQSIGAVLSQGDFLPYIHAVGITNQRETVVVWDRNTSRPIANAIVWQCRRTAEFCDSLIADGHADMIRRKTGLTVNPYFSASKLRWLLDNVPGAREKARRGELLFGTVDTWIIWKLTGGRVHATDVTNASRTMLYNINTGCWDKELLELFDIPPCMLPEVLPCNGDFGRAHICGRDIPITGCAGDQQAALFGQCCFEPGETKTTYGTGAFLLMNTGEVACRSTRGLVTTLAWRLDGEKPVYALEGSVFIAGALIEWLRDEMGFFSKSADCEALARSVNDTGGVYIVPAFVGLGAPYWDSYARGTIVGLTRGSSKAHLARAALEAIAFQINDVVSLMQIESALSVTEMKTDGGASANGLLMQLQADISGLRIHRPPNTETTALGAAMLAGLGSGLFENIHDLKSKWQVESTFVPSITREARSALLRGWEKAVHRAENWCEP